MKWGSLHHSTYSDTFSVSEKVVRLSFFDAVVERDVKDIGASLYGAGDISLTICNLLKNSVNDDRSLALVFLVYGRMVGFIHEKRSDDTTKVIIDQIYVHQDFKGKYGIGGRLLTEFLSRAKEKGAKLAEAEVWPRAQKFYAKHGFAPCAHSRRKIMQKVL